MSSTESLPMQIKANRNGFTLVPDPAASFADMLAYLRQRLEESRDFFQHAEMLLDLRASSLGTVEIRDLHALLVEKAGVKLVEVRLSEELTLTLDRPARPVSPPPVRPQTAAQEPVPVVIRSTCRSGARVVSAADCIVLGDVNPGAEIVAVGDIIVFGYLRGIAHAGATGDHSARIWALSIEPNQLRIADVVGLPPTEGKRPNPKHYEIAAIQNGRIEISVL